MNSNSHFFIKFNAFIKWIIENPKRVIFLISIATLGFLTQLRSLQVIFSPDATLPQSHPYIATTNRVEELFGSKFTLVIDVTATQGDIYQPAILEKVQRITNKILEIPGVVKGNVFSFSTRRTKSIFGSSDGMEVRRLMETVPKDQAGLDRLRRGVESNPIYKNLLISNDRKTTQIIAEFRRVTTGFTKVEAAAEAAVQPERDDSVQISIGGSPVFLSLLEKYSARMSWLFPLAVLVIGLIHYEAFLTVQALVLPLVTAIFAVIWSLGLLGISRQPFDVFNVATPILILAIAAGHAVQILKRYYEEYGRIRKENPELSEVESNREAIRSSLTKVGPVMLVAGGIAAAGFLSLMIFEIKSIRTFGLFTAGGIVSTLVIELTLIPAIRSLLKPPGQKELTRESTRTIWDRVVDYFFSVCWNKRKQVYLVTAALLLAMSAGIFQVRTDNSQKGYFYTRLQGKIDDDRINEKMAGTNTVYILVQGDSEDSVKDPAVLSAMDQVQRFAEKDPMVGRSVSIVDYIKRMHMAMNGDKQDFYVVPQNRDLIGQYLMLYSSSGEPEDFDSYVDNGYQNTVARIYLKTDSSAYISAFAKRTQAFADGLFPSTVRVQVGGGATAGVALTEVMVHEKILNILQIMFVVFVVTSLVFRSFVAGGLVLVPLVLVVVINFGFMGLTGIPMQIGTALVSAMAVGIGADYAIYMSYRMKEELLKHAGESRHDEEAEKQSLLRAFRSAGKATLFVSFAVAGGFGLLMFSWGFLTHFWMGLLIALAMIVSSLSTLSVFPSLIFDLKPQFIFGKKRSSSVKVSLTEPAVAVTIGLLVIGIFSQFKISKLANADSVNLDAILRKNYAVGKVIDSISDGTITLINHDGQTRVRKTVGKTKLRPGTLDNQRLVRFESPADVKGMVTLTIENSSPGQDDDIWVYLPALKKVRRLVSSNKKDSFAGTDFSYGDVIGQKVSDWNHKLLREETIDGNLCYVVESLPKDDKVKTDSGYSKRITWIAEKTLVSIQSEIYDTSGQLLKTIHLFQIENVDPKLGKWVAMRLEASNVQTQHKTVIEFTNYHANQNLPDSAFTARAIEKES